LEGNWKVPVWWCKAAGRWGDYNQGDYPGRVLSRCSDSTKGRAMKHDLEGKKALIISDNGGLARVVELNLRIRLGMKVLKYDPDLSGQDRYDDLDLLVLAISSPSREPILELARASLVERIGQVSLLIISDRPFQSEPDEDIVHLDFPFTIDALESKVRGILHKKAQSDTADRPSSLSEGEIKPEALAEGGPWSGTSE
jgi:hypothetical protein